MIHVKKCEDCGEFIDAGYDILMADWATIGRCCFNEGDNFLSAGVHAFNSTKEVNHEPTSIQK